MNMLTTVKKWALPLSLIVGTVVYLVFSRVECLSPVADTAGPFLVKSMPYVMFAILYVTFCKIKISDLKPRGWHIRLQVVRILLPVLLMAGVLAVGDPTARLLLEGAFVCFICPTAAAAAVVTEKLGGGVGGLATYTLIDNVTTAVLISLTFPLIEPAAGMGFGQLMLVVLGHTTSVLVLPLVLAQVSRKLLPRWTDMIRRTRNLGFYLWCFNLSVVTGVTVGNVVNDDVPPMTLTLLLLIPLGATLIQFALGKTLGRRYGESISAGQAFGQKNTVVAIWLALTFLNPLASLAPGGYVIWQNAVNSWQIWYKQKYGRVKW